MRDQLSICNGALDELPATAIQSINDPDDEGALACRRNYSKVFEDLLDLNPYGWDASIRRTVGAETTNERVGEWLFCYQYPTEARTMLRVLPDYSLTPVNTVVLPGQFAAPLVGYFASDVGVPYIVAAGKIYTNLQYAVLEYIAADPELSLFSPLFHRAFELTLAERICMPVIKSRSRKKELIAEAELYRQRAMADDLNNSPKRYDTHPSEEEMVRNDMTAPGWYAS